MSYAAAIHALLAADGTFTGLLTGGVYLYGAEGRLDVTRQTHPAAFDATTGQLKPLCSVRGRATVPDGRLADDAAKTLSMRQVVELWFYNTGNAGYATITSAADRAFTLLHETRLSAGGKVRLVNELDNERAAELQNAALIRRDYAVFGLKS